MPNKSSSSDERGAWRWPAGCESLLAHLHAESGAQRWGLSLQALQTALARSAAKRFSALGLAAGTIAKNDPLNDAKSSRRVEITAGQVQEYFSTIHLCDLALACACAEGLEPAWNEFVAAYRGYLRASAAAILRIPATDPAAVELADSLFADLYGLSDGKARRSLFLYFHGRSSLKTWLRAVLAQRHIDSIRAAKKFDSLDDQGDDGERPRPPELGSVVLPADPHREMYLRRFREALALALDSLDARDRLRLQLYYAQDRTLAEIGKRIGEHESSVSRNLERVRKELRSTVEGLLRTGQSAITDGAAPAFDDAQIQLCIQYAGEDAGIDLDKLFDAQGSTKPPGPDRIVES